MSNFNQIILAFLFLIIINGCNNSTIGSVVKSQEFTENKIEIEPYFCPKDDCEEILINNINIAKSVHCAFYDLDLYDLIKAFGKKSSNADVKIVIEDSNYGGNIKGPGIKIAKASQYMHNKFCVLDDNKVLTGSMNPTNNGANLNNNNLIIIKSKYIASNYEDEFKELWNGIYASGNNVKFNKINTDIGVIENYFCPEDCTLENDGGIYRIKELVKNAEKSIKIASFSFTHEALADELIKADIKGLDVDVLVERRQRNVRGSEYARLKDFGINIKVDGNKYNMHHKFIIIDDEIVITGSPNFTLSGNNRNDENMLIIFNQNLALEYGKEFDGLFEKGEVVY
jgi:phosphatidylserine/phosphatidylglycerophosphate/cardiolipin synthase-like enzyme